MIRKSLNHSVFNAVSVMALVLCCTACGSSNTGSASPETETQTLQQADPESAAGPEISRLVSGLVRATGQVLTQVNTKLSEGQALSPLESRCFAGYNPALGQSAMAFDCDEQSIIVPGVENNARVAMQLAALSDSASCADAVQIGKVDPCELEKAELEISTQWVNTGPQSRPTPIRGALLSYDSGTRALNLRSVEQPQYPPFDCMVDLDTGLPEARVDECLAILGEMADRLDSLLPG